MLEIKDLHAETELRKFLFEAKRDWYIGDGEWIYLPEGDRGLLYEKDSWKYQTKECGFSPFFGQERVWYEEKLLWVMNFNGELNSKKIRELNSKVKNS